MTTSQTSQKSIPSIGALLVAARNHAALNQNEVANQTKLPLSTIRALENDEFEKLPEYTYVRGYLRLYAQVVEIEAKDIIKAYDEQYHVVPKISSVVGPKDNFNQVVLWGMVAVATLLVGLLVILWAGEKFIKQEDNKLTSEDPVFFSPDPEDGKAVTSLSAASGGAADTNEAVVQESTSQVLPAMENQGTVTEEQSLPPNRDENIGRDVGQEPVLQVEQEPALQVEQEPVLQVEQDQSLSSDLVVTNEGVDVLTLKYTGESWTVVSDADLNPLLRRLVEKGAVRSFKGKAPFHVFLGNSQGVVVEINGKHFDHSRFEKDNRTAKFQVPGNLSN